MMFIIAFDEFKKAAAVLGKFLDQDVTRALLSPAFGANVKNHLIAEMDNHLEVDKQLGDGGSVTFRGQTHRGFAEWETAKYGETVVEGTRYRMRKRRLDKRFVGPRDRGFYRNQSRTFAGTLGARSRDRKNWLAQDVASRPFEKVFKKRASGALYDDSSHMMLDNGTLRNSLVTMTVTVKGNIVEFRPGPGCDYFDRQNDMRPLFVLFPPVDEPVIQKFLTDALMKMFPADVSYGTVVE